MNNTPRLLGMTLEQHMGLDLIELEFDPDTYVIKVSGKNESGKTRLINSVPYAFGVRGFTPEEPITHGRTSGRVFLVYDAFTIERKAKKGQPTQLVVKKKGESKPISSPQTFLDTLIPPVVMNPTDFCTKFTDKQRLEFLYEIMGNRDKIDALDKEAECIYDDRRNVNRDIAALKGKLSGHDEADEEPTAEISIGSLIAERQQASDEDARKKARQEWVTKAEESIEKHCEFVNQYRVQIAEIEKKIETTLLTAEAIKAEIKEQQHILDNTASVSRIPGIDARMQSLETVNATAREITTRNLIRAELRDKTAESDKGTRRLKAIEQEKIDIIATANIPVAGLTIEDQQIKVNGLPWTQQSTAQALLNAMKLVDMKSPALRHMVVDFALLDSESRQVVQEFAEEYDYTVFAELVKDTVEEAAEEGAIFMDAGKVVLPHKTEPMQETLAI